VPIDYFPTRLMHSNRQHFLIERLISMVIFARYLEWSSARSRQAVLLGRRVARHRIPLIVRAGEVKSGMHATVREAVDRNSIE
jgi:hypothetical protein